MSNKINRRGFLKGLAVAAGSGILAACQPQVVKETVIVEKPVEKVVKETVIVQPESTEIQFMTWDYTSGNQAMGAVIDAFHKVSNNRVEFTAVPYAEYNEKIAALVPAGEGPDVAKPYYGWIPAWKDPGFILPLPQEAFPPAELAANNPPLCKSIVIDGKWWGVPLSVRSMGIYYRNDAFREVGLTPPITSWAPDGGELYEALVKLTKYDSDGNLARMGKAVGGHWDFTCQLWQNGQPGHSDDFRTIQWNASEKGYEAWEWNTNIYWHLYKGQQPLLTSGAAGFVLDQDCMYMTHVGGIGRARTEIPVEYEFATMELFAGPAGKANMGTFWPMVMTSKAAEDPKNLDVAIEFLQYCGTRDPQVAFASFTGELPSLISVSSEPLFTNNPLLAPFIAQLGNTFSYFYVDEKEERDIYTNNWSRITEGEEPRQVLDDMVAELQAVRDAYFEDK